jgi:hypothetical protein
VQPDNSSGGVGSGFEFDAGEKGGHPNIVYEALGIRNMQGSAYLFDLTQRLHLYIA